MKLEAKITSEGGKKTIYSLKSQLLELLSNYSCRYEITTSRGSNSVESISAVLEVKEAALEDVIEVVPEDIIEVEAGK
jgi:hypothetical protein